MKLKMIIGIFGLFLLGACDDFGPYDVTLKTTNPFQLKAKSGSVVNFEANQTAKSYVIFGTDRKHILIWYKGDNFEFKNATFNKDTQTAQSDAKNSGQVSNGSKVGIKLQRTQICDPLCVNVVTEEKYASCTYYESRSETHCTVGPQPECYTDWVDYPVSGTQWARVTSRVEKFNIFSEITTDARAELARADGIQVLEEEIGRVALERCH